MSKTLAEKTAWALAMDREVNMVTINAGLLMAHDLSIKSPYLRGAAEMYEDGVFVTVDLDFLVNAHICVYEDVSSYGRYLCFNRIINTHDDAVKLARKLTPTASSLSQRSVIELFGFVAKKFLHNLFGEINNKVIILYRSLINKPFYLFILCSNDMGKSYIQQRISNKKLNKLMVHAL